MHQFTVFIELFRFNYLKIKTGIFLYLLCHIVTVTVRGSVETLFHTQLLPSSALASDLNSN
jgi:hypothetical protein